MANVRTYHTRGNREPKKRRKQRRVKRARQPRRSLNSLDRRLAMMSEWNLERLADMASMNEEETLRPSRRERNESQRELHG